MLLHWYFDRCGLWPHLVLRINMQVSILNFWSHLSFWPFGYIWHHLVLRKKTTIGVKLSFYCALFFYLSLRIVRVTRVCLDTWNWNSLNPIPLQRAKGKWLRNCWFSNVSSFCFPTLLFTPCNFLSGLFIPHHKLRFQSRDAYFLCPLWI